MGFIYLSVANNVPHETVDDAMDQLIDGDWPVIVPALYAPMATSACGELLAAAKELWFFVYPGWKTSIPIANDRDMFFHWYGDSRPMREFHWNQEEQGFYLATYTNLHVF